MFSKKETPTTRLRELSGSDYTIAKGQPDIRGWDVRDGNGRKFGVVNDLIFDIRANKVRYMVLNIFDTRELELEKRTVLVPIGMAELDPADNDVLLPSVTPFQLRALPRYDKNNLGAKVERDISTVFGREGFGTTTAAAGTTAAATTVHDDRDVHENFYNHDHFNEDNMYRRRRGTTATGGQTTDRRLTEEELYLRREAELGRPLTAAEVQEINNRQRGLDDDSMDRRETDEEYYRRTGRDRRKY